MSVFADPDALALYLPALTTGLAIAVMCAILSPLVVLKRLSFVGQGISHAAFGGVGVASVLGIGMGVAAGSASQFLVVLVFCILSGLLIARLTRRSAGEADTAIGIVLVGAMTLGAILIEAGSRLHARPPPSWESILFGSIISVGWTDAATAWGVCAGIVGSAWIARRPLMFWAFDEPAAEAFGVSTGAMRYLLVFLLTLAIVTAMKLAGVVLATALLVLPGAVALRLSDRWWSVVGLSLAAAGGGVGGGLTLSFIFGRVPPGACVVSVLVILFGAAIAFQSLRGARAVRPA